MDNSVNIKTKLFKFCVLILNIILEGIVSQIFLLGLSSYFMLFRQFCLQNLFLKIVIFVIKKKPRHK